MTERNEIDKLRDKMASDLATRLARTAGPDGRVSIREAVTAALVDDAEPPSVPAPPSGPGPGGGGIRSQVEDAAMSPSQVATLARDNPAKFNELFEAGKIPGAALAGRTGRGGFYMP